LKNRKALIEVLLISSIVATVIGCGGGNTTTFQPAAKEETPAPEFKD
jgi:hypothetical protein